MTFVRATPQQVLAAVAKQRAAFAEIPRSQVDRYILTNRAELSHYYHSMQMLGKSPTTTVGWFNLLRDGGLLWNWARLAAADNH